MTQNPRQTFIRGVGIYPFKSADELINFVAERPSLLVAINAEKIIHATPYLKELYNRNVGYSDGIGAVYALKRKGQRAVKIAGADLWHKIAERFHNSKSFYLIGGKQEVIDQTVDQLKSEFPDINITGYRNGYLKDGDEEALLNSISELKPEVVFVAMGSPKQEKLMEKMQSANPNCIYQGLGGSFDVYTGRVERAPKWWIDHGMEWLYRLIKEPKRIKRQIHLFRLIGMVITNRI